MRVGVATSRTRAKKNKNERERKQVLGEEEFIRKGNHSLLCTSHALTVNSPRFLPTFAASEQSLFCLSQLLCDAVAKSGNVDPLTRNGRCLSPEFVIAHARMPPSAPSNDCRSATCRRNRVCRGISVMSQSAETRGSGGDAWERAGRAR